MTDSMFELEQVLTLHAAKYPLMQPTDAVKLIYQNEFGGGHLIQNEAACLEYLRKEYESVEKDPSVSLWESIGNGILRVNLAAVREDALQDLGQAFIRSAALHQGDMRRFLEKLDLLRRLTEKGVFPFPKEALDMYLADYAAAGYPAVSHSPQYRAAYTPAYRIICREYLSR